MNRRGTALLLALWFLVVASGLALSTLGALRLGLTKSGNRIELRQGRWAAEGCLAAVQSAFRATGQVAAVDSLDLGAGVWCRVEMEDPGASLNVNAADPGQWRALLNNDTLAAAVMDWVDPDDRPTPLGAERPWYRARDLPGPRNAPLLAVEELRNVRGMGDARLDLVRPYLTTRGDGRIDVNTAPARVLALLPGLDDRYANEIVAARRQGRRLGGVDELLARAPGEIHAAMLSAYFELTQRTTFTPSMYLLHCQGRTTTGPPAEILVTVVPTAGRLAVVRKEIW